MSDNNIANIVITYLELLWTGPSHTEKLSHEFFYVVTALIIGIWTISIQYITSKIDKIIMNILPIALSLMGLLMIYKLQKSVHNTRVHINRIRKWLKIDDIECENGESLIPEKWKKYKLETIKDAGLIKREGLKAEDTNYSWWGIYKFLYSMMLVISIFLFVKAFF